jgi:hypothetical protein
MTEGEWLDLESQDKIPPIKSEDIKFKRVFSQRINPKWFRSSEEYQKFLKMKTKKEQKQINRIYSEINLLSSELEVEIESQFLLRTEIIEGCARVLLAAGVDSRLVVEVLERFGDRGSDMIMSIKVNEGW